MYQLFYNLAIRSYGKGIRLASLFNKKASEWHRGRVDLFERLQAELSGVEKIIWFHAASLGEAEQGLPIMRRLREIKPDHKLLLTFFSPSGMNHFTHKEVADYLHYLPLDTPANARQFLDIVKPELAFFIKYEIWPNCFKEIQQRKIPLIIAPAIFRPDQFYFKSLHRDYFLPILQEVDEILVQNQASKDLLAEHAISSTVVGDSRFERVLENSQAPFVDPVLEEFSHNATVLIGGSTWEPGEKILKEILSLNPSLKIIIAPHDISSANIERVEKLFGKEVAFRYSRATTGSSEKRVCIIDNIGKLSRLYRYGDVAYIGGAFGKGIHNSLEAVAYGLPVFFGPNHQNFIEPRAMIEAGFAFEISKVEDMQAQLEPMLQQAELLQQRSALARAYIEAGSGSVEKILAHLRPYL